MSIKNWLLQVPNNTALIIAILRIIIGAMLIYHSWKVFNAAQMKEYSQWDIFKNSPYSLLMPYIGKSTELLCGLLLSLGVFTKVAAVLLICTMSYITFKIGNGIIWYGDQHPFMFLLFGILFFLAGPGKWSIDHLIFKPISKYKLYK